MSELIELENSYPIYLTVKLQTFYSRQDTSLSPLLVKLSRVRKYCLSDGNRVIEFVIDQAVDGFRIIELRETSVQSYETPSGCDDSEQLLPILKGVNILGAFTPTVNSLFTEFGFQQNHASKSHVCYTKTLTPIQTTLRDDSGATINALRKPRIVACVYFNQDSKVTGLRLEQFENFESLL